MGNGGDGPKSRLIKTPLGADGYLEVKRGWVAVVCEVVWCSYLQTEAPERLLGIQRPVLKLLKNMASITERSDSTGTLKSDSMIGNWGCNLASLNLGEFDLIVGRFRWNHKCDEWLEGGSRGDCVKYVLKDLKHSRLQLTWHSHRSLTRRSESHEWVNSTEHWEDDKACVIRIDEAWSPRGSVPVSGLHR